MLKHGVISVEVNRGFSPSLNYYFLKKSNQESSFLIANSAKDGKKGNREWCDCESVFCKNAVEGFNGLRYMAKGGIHPSKGVRYFSKGVFHPSKVVHDICKVVHDLAKGVFYQLKGAHDVAEVGFHPSKGVHHRLKGANDVAKGMVYL